VPPSCGATLGPVISSAQWGLGPCRRRGGGRAKSPECRARGSVTCLGFRPLYPTLRISHTFRLSGLHHVLDLHPVRPLMSLYVRRLGFVWGQWSKRNWGQTRGRACERVDPFTVRTLPSRRLQDTLRCLSIMVAMESAGKIGLALGVVLLVFGVTENGTTSNIVQKIEIQGTSQVSELGIWKGQVVSG